jgi:hypothetical protein
MLTSSGCASITTNPTLELRDINNIPETWKAHLVEVKLIL